MIGTLSFSYKYIPSIWFAAWRFLFTMMGHRLTQMNPPSLLGEPHGGSYSY